MEKESKNRDFCMFYRHYMLDVASLGKENPNALRVFMFLSQNMDGYNALCISQQALQEALGISRTTLWRAVEYLKHLGWLHVLKTGTSNIYIINPELVWTSYENQKKYCKFPANIIISASENVDFVKNPKYARRYKHIEAPDHQSDKTDE